MQFLRKHLFHFSIYHNLLESGEGLDTIMWFINGFKKGKISYLGILLDS